MTAQPIAVDDLAPHARFTILVLEMLARELEAVGEQKAADAIRATNERLFP